MTPMVWLLSIWGVLTALLIILLIYRSTLSMHEEEQLFLSDSDAHMQEEQVALSLKLSKMNPYLWGMGSLSGVLILVIAGIAIYQQMSMVQ
jgi:ABC-type transport system involved in multi-copper enzyme maturation permease subunit